MAVRLVAAGHEVRGVDVDEGARQRAADAGVAVGSFADLSGCAVVCSSLPDTPQVEDAYLAPGGILDNLAPSAVCFDLSTIAVAASRRVAVTCRARGVFYLDCPVSGTSIHAEAGTLAIMVGGDAGALERNRAILEVMASSVRRVGDNGAGLRLKLITNRLLTSHLIAIGEAVLAMEDSGIDVAEGLDVVRSGAVPRLLDYKAGPVAERDYTPNFTIDLMRKDLALAAEVLPDTPVGLVAAEIVEEAAGLGLGSQDVAAVMAALERRLRS